MCFDCEFGKNHQFYSFSKLYSIASQSTNIIANKFQYDKPKMNFSEITSQFRNLFQPPVLERQRSMSRTPNRFYVRPGTPLPPTYTASPTPAVLAPVDPLFTFPRVMPPSYDTSEYERMMIEHHYNDVVDGIPIRNHYRCSRGHIVALEDSDDETYPDPPEIVCPIPIMGMNPIKYYAMCQVMEDKCLEIIKRRNRILFNKDVFDYSLGDNFCYRK